jgi:hypothetical protein
MSDEPRTQLSIGTPEPKAGFASCWNLGSKAASDRDRIKRMEAAAEAELSKSFY